MSKRRHNTCIFCGKPSGSREHALPAWLAESMGRQNDPILPAMFASTGGWETNGNPRSAGNVVTKRVCHDCNTGWMCALEAGVKPVIDPWLNIESSQLTRDTLQLSPENLRNVNRWLLKTACCLREVAPRGQLEKLPASASQWAFENALPPSCKTYAGWIRESSCGFRISRGFATLNGHVFHERQQHLESFEVLVQLNHLAVRIVNAPNAEFSRMPIRNFRGVLCTPNFWSHASQPPGTECDSCVFDDVHSFSAACVVRPLPPTTVESPS